MALRCIAGKQLRMNTPISAPDRTSKGRQAGIGFIMIVVLIDMVSIGLIIPVLPRFVGTFTDSPAAQALWLGAVLFAFGFANFIGSPILGALSDRFGRRPVLLIGFCGLGLNFFATALATSLWMLIGVRLIGGAMQANGAVASAYVADITPPEMRARRFGMLGAMFGLGFILGPALGGILGHVNIHLPFFVAGGLTIANWLYGYFVLPESLAVENRRPIQWRNANPISSLKRLSMLKGVGSLVAVMGLAGLAQFTMQSTWVLFTTFRFGWNEADNGWSLCTVGIMSVLVQGFLLKHFLRWFGARKFIVIGLTSGTLAYWLWGYAGQSWMMYAVIVCNVFAFGTNAAIQSLMSNSASSSDQGQTMGAVSALTSLMAVVAPVVGPALLATVSHLPAGDWRVGMPLYFCALLQGIGAIIAMRYLKTHGLGQNPSQSSSS